MVMVLKMGLNIGLLGGKEELNLSSFYYQTKDSFFSCSYYFKLPKLQKKSLFFQRIYDMKEHSHGNHHFIIKVNMPQV